MCTCITSQAHTRPLKQVNKWQKPQSNGNHSRPDKQQNNREVTGSHSPQQRVYRQVRAHTHARIWTYSGKYCMNPHRHIFGECLKCRGLTIDERIIDPRDVVKQCSNNETKWSYMQEYHHIRQQEATKNVRQYLKRNTGRRSD